KIVTTLHGTDITLVGQDPSYYTLTKFSIEQSDRVTAVSTFLREETYRAFGCAGCDVIVIPNFISTAEYHPPGGGTCRRSLAPPDHKILVHVSNFRPVKRVTDRSATRRSRKSIASSSDATSGFSARWTTSPKSCEAATCSCCRPRPSR